MTFLFAESCDGHISLNDRWTIVDPGASIITDGGKYGVGTNSIRLASGLDFVLSDTFATIPSSTRGSTANPIHISLFFKGNPADLPSSSNYAILALGSTADGGSMAMTIDTTGALTISQYVSAASWYSTSSHNTSLGFTSGINVFDGDWHHIEMVYAVHASAGIIKVWIDGVQQIDLTPDTISGSATLTGSGIDAIAIRCPIGSSLVEFDDIIVWDEEGSEFAVTGQNGVHRLETLIPNAAGSSTGFSVTGAASNYLAVDEVGADYNTSYVESGVSTTKDLYNFTNLSGVPDTIQGVWVTSVATNPDSANINMRHRVKSGATEAFEASKQLTAAGIWSGISDFIHQDPNTTAAWTATNLNAAEFGMEVV